MKFLYLCTVFFPSIYFLLLFFIFIFFASRKILNYTRLDNISPALSVSSHGVGVTQLYLGNFCKLSFSLVQSAFPFSKNQLCLCTHVYIHIYIYYIFPCIGSICRTQRTGKCASIFSTQYFMGA